MASDFRACRPSLPGLLRLSCRTAWSVWKPHRSCAAAPQAVWQPHKGLLLWYNSTTVAVQQPQGLLLPYNSTIVAAEQARIWAENIESGTNVVGKPSFGLKLCVVRAVPLRMTPACLDCQKTKKSVNKTGAFAIFGPPAPSGPMSALFRVVDHALRIVDACKP